MNDEPIFIAPYDPEWPEKFEKEKKFLQETIGPFINGEINHIGSTSIPGLSAKPIIDIMVGVESLDASRPAIEILENTGYCYYPYKPKFMHWFCKPSPVHRTHHLHLVPTTSPEYKAKIAFRDYLRANPEARQQYEDLKTKKAEEFRNDREAYTEAKTDFVKSIVRKVLGQEFIFEV